MNKFSVLALVALSAMAGIASSQNPVALNTCVALAGGMGSTKSTATGTSGTVCYYSDAACATSADTLCGQMRTMAEEAATTAGQSVSYSACKAGCFSAGFFGAGTNTNNYDATNTNTETKSGTSSGGTSSGGTSQSGASDGSTEGTGLNQPPVGASDGSTQGTGSEGTGSNQPPAGAEGGSTQGTASNHDDASHDGHDGHDDGAAVTNSPVSVDVQAAGHSEMEGGGGMFEMFSAAEQKELGVGNKGDKCKGFKIFFASQAAEQKCQAFDTETACEAGGCEYQCNFKVNNVCKQAKCQPSAATTQKIMGITIDEEKAQADMLAKIAGKTEEEGKKIMKDEMKKYLKPMVPVMNNLNTTMVEIAKFMKRCGGGKTKAACAADKVCELQLAFNASTNNFTQQCNVNKAKAVEETGCSGVARAVADLDALERKAVAAGAKKALAGKQKKQKGAKDAVEEYKKANPTATADTDTALKALETQAASADAEVIAASATVTTADAEATAAEQKAAATPADSSTLRALPSIMAVVAATVAAAFA